ncbi:myelin protein zero-like protein 1 isoform X2 [Xenopus laevis]|uniref:Myelin protein P0 n=2 Tax=Xenopus laevis TaxID=8355 RepID=A0A974HX37_XENLA|nr:myelin protein zero-like protein 1 isoform X2 [Xenopus laevis]OCT93647.1 hypothetical protein XELAEV_18011322mg [Xenopus laevis]
MAAAEMLVCRGERWRRGLFALVFLCYVHFSRAADVSPPEELFVENGTQARLPCNFKSMESSSIQQSVTWRFKPDSGSDPVTIFYYSSGTSYPPNAGQFKDRISWASDLTRKDASIKVNNMQFKDNGTYTCSVVTLPDLGSMTKEIRLKVVEKENLPLSNGPLLIGIICAVISALLIIASIIFAICIYKKKKSRKNYTGKAFWHNKDKSTLRYSMEYHYKRDIVSGMRRPCSSVCIASACCFYLIPCSTIKSLAHD